MVEQQAIRVLIADRERETRARLRRLVESDERFTVVGEAVSGAETIERIEVARPDIVVLDTALRDMDGIHAIPVIVERSPRARILAMTGPRGASVDELKRLGAHECIDRQSAAEELPERLAVMFPDIQAPLELNEQTPSVRSTVDEILALLVHEVQAPLSVIEGFSLALQVAVERGDDDAILEATRGIRRANASLRSLIGSFADVGAMESGHLSLNLRDAQMVQLVKLTVDDLSTRVGSHALAVDSGEDFWARIDSVRIRQVITNLITNSVKFSPRHSKITVRVRRENDWARVSVSDQGPGIPAHSQGELFQKFSRLGSTGSGTGLGLYLSRGIARAHQGDLTCESAAGRGATFTLSLPLKPVVASDP